MRLLFVWSRFCTKFCHSAYWECLFKILIIHSLLFLCVHLCTNLFGTSLMRLSVGNCHLWDAVMREPRGQEQSMFFKKIHLVHHVYILKDGTDLKVGPGKISIEIRRDISTAIPDSRERIDLISVVVLAFLWGHNMFYG